MSKRKNKIKQPKLSRGKIIPETLLRARNLRSSLLRRVSSSQLKETTPTIFNIEKWLNLENFTCFYCFKGLILNEIEVDHKTPLVRGGNNTLENLCTCCSSCNKIKGEMTAEEFRELIELTRLWEDTGAHLFIRLKRGNNIFKK